MDQTTVICENCVELIKNADELPIVLCDRCKGADLEQQIGCLISPVQLGAPRRDVATFVGVDYYHHGVFLSSGMILQMSNTGQIKSAFVSDFLGKSTRVVIVRHAKRSTDQEIEARAKSLENTEEVYDLFKNNCEHVATGCMTGTRMSKQVDDLFNGKRAMDTLKKTIPELEPAGNRMKDFLIGGLSAAYQVLGKRIAGDVGKVDGQEGQPRITLKRRMIRSVANGLEEVAKKVRKLDQ